MLGVSFEKQVHELFLARGWTLCLAESCTGGALAARLTAQAGSSRYFLGGIVAYSNAFKSKLLNVQTATLKDKGAISEEVVKEMVDGALTLSGSDFAVAVSGIAGPDGGTASKPVGTVWCAVGRKGKKPLAWVLQLDGDREQVINGSVNAVLDGLLRYAQDELKE